MTRGRPGPSLRHLHRDERWIAFASRPLGRTCVFAVAALLLLPLPIAGFVTETTLLAIVLCTLYPAQRPLWLSAAGVCFLGHWLAAGWNLRGADVDANHVVAFALASGALVATSVGVYALALREHATARWLARRALLLWHLLVWGLLLGASAHPVVGTAAVFMCWRVGYALRAARAGRAAGRLRDHFYYFWPIWGGSMVPYGKGGEYLRRHAAADPNAIARSQLAGLKLLVLAWGWRGVEALFDAAVYGAPGATLSALGGTTLGWPELAALIDAGGESVPAWQRWSLLLVGLVSRTLEIAIPGHVIVAKLRLFGFNVFRNTYKPLLAESILEFWNRFFYYFKELLVEFFFLPTYARGWKDRPTLRLFVAVFAAAGVGNLYYHLMVFALEGGASLGLPAWRELLASRGLYCALLATGVFVSMLRERGRRGQPADPGRAHPLRRVRRIAGVWLFFSLLYIWGTEPVELSFADRNRFLLSLFGVGGP